MLHAQFAALVLTALALVASGCGKSSKTESTSAAAATTTAPATTTTTAPTTTVAVTTGKPLTRAQLISLGDAICARTNAKTSVIFAKTIQEFTRIYPEIVLYQGTEAKELSQLVPPSSMKANWEHIIHDLELHRRYLDEVAHDIEAKTNNAGRPFHLASVVIEDLFTTAKHAGFKNCSRAS